MQSRHLKKQETVVSK